MGPWRYRFFGVSLPLSFLPSSCYHSHIDPCARSCHGPAIYPGVIDPSTNKSIINGKTITGFTTEGEDVMGITDIVRGWGEPLVDEWAERLGAKCEGLPHAIESGTGANDGDEQMRDHLACGTTSTLLMDGL